MPTISIDRKFSVTLLATMVFLIPAACNVDSMYRDKQAPKGPVVQPGAVADAPAESPETLPAVAERREVDLVEELVAYRSQYHRTLQDLRDYYRAHGYATKLAWAEFELDGLKKVKAFRYLLDAEVASNQLRPVDQIAEADALYEKGVKLMKEGGHGVPVFYRQKVMLEAADVLRQLIETHPTSDKIDDAAFLLGEIHKEYLPDQEAIAVKWYERAWTWDPQTPHAARFQAAVIHDFRLHDRDRALELYQNVLKDEAWEQSNVRFSTRRIEELSRETRRAEAATPVRP